MSDASVYSSSAIKRKRRTRAEMDVIDNAMLTIVNSGEGMTIRHLFYRMVAAGVIEKTEDEYHGTVVKRAVALRRSFDIPHGKIIDGSRLYTVPDTHNGLHDAISATAPYYRRNYWRDADRTVEVLCEKDAIRALIQPITFSLAVPLMVTRGFASESIVQDLARETLATGKPKVVLSLNDYDPSGSIMAAGILRRARHYALEATFITKQVALTRDQVDAYELPTRPTKTDGNSHAAKFEDARSVELDAMEPSPLRALLQRAIEEHIDSRRLNLLEIAEESERRTLLELARSVGA